MTIHSITSAAPARPIAVGDIVITPMRREALVCDRVGDRVSCIYLDANDRADQVTLLPALLRFVRRGEDDLLLHFDVERGS